MLKSVEEFSSETLFEIDDWLGLELMLEFGLFSVWFIAGFVKF